MKSTLRGHRLNTVCEEAMCPNKPECFSKPTATFLILGPSCTRNCSFCSVKTSGAELLSPPDLNEPIRIAEAAMEMKLNYVVITSVTRDDLSDGGASVFSATVRAIKEAIKDVRVEVLVPDFKGSREALRVVMDSGPDVFNHNVETVPSLYSSVRPQAVYSRSLKVLSDAKGMSRSVLTKSGLMLGLGETIDEVQETLLDLRAAGCDLLTIGQYLRPSLANIPVHQYIEPEFFDRIRDIALEMGFSSVASSPLTRSSMNAENIFINNNSGDRNVRV